MGTQQELQNLLLTLADNVYFQPPEGKEIVYPCIVYKWNKIQVDYANNNRYRKKKAYMVTIIDKDPNSPIAELVAELQLSSFDRTFTADQLNHFVYTVFF